MKNYAVYAYGVISSSTLHLLNQPFPTPDGYAELGQTFAMTGGEALNSAIVLSRLGVSVFLDGNWLGDSAEGQRLLATIRQYQIDTRRLKLKKGYAGVYEIVFSDENTRTIFGNYIDLLATTRKWNVPRKTDLAKAQIICVDPPFREESAQVGKYAVELGLPYVTIDCPHDQDFTRQAAVVIISGEFRAREYPGVELAELFSTYQQAVRGLVVFTVGSAEILYGRAGEPVRRFTPYQVKVIDSAGAGDSFRAGFIYGLLQKWGDAQIIRYAAAISAMVCASFPGVLNSPTHPEVLKFLAEQEITTK